MFSIRFFGFALILLFGCSQCNQPDKALSTWKEIHGRQDPTLSPFPIYRIRVPIDWDFQENKKKLEDTTFPLCEIFIREEQQAIRITIHNFPTSSLEERVPPQAQIERWKRQIENCDFASCQILPQAFGGFQGLFFQGSGISKDQNITVLGWSMQLDEGSYQAFSELEEEKRIKAEQMRADYTIKAVGPTELVEKYKTSMISFARSFELIDEIPILE